MAKVMFDEYGRAYLHENTDGMHDPVCCTYCGKVYDLGTVTVTARYADCSMWKSPCCGRTVDDRMWKSLPDYRPLRGMR